MPVIKVTTNAVLVGLQFTVAMSQCAVGLSSMEAHSCFDNRLQASVEENSAVVSIFNFDGENPHLKSLWGQTLLYKTFLPFSEV